MRVSSYHLLPLLVPTVGSGLGLGVSSPPYTREHGEN